MNYFVHKTSIIDENCQIGEATKIWHWTHVSSNVNIGKNCVLGQNVFIGKNVKIGNNVKIQNNVSIFEGVILEDDVFCGPSCVFTNVKNPRSANPQKENFQTTIVKRGATIGANATIVCGNSLGENCFIAAASLVTKDVPAKALVVGVPGKISGTVDEKGNAQWF